MAKTMIEINGISTKIVPIKSTGLVFDKDGKKFKYADAKSRQIIEIVSGEGKKSEWRYKDDGTLYEGTEYKMIGGVAKSKFPKTTEIKKFDIIPKTDIKFKALGEYCYLVANKQIKEWIKGLDAQNQAVTFRFTNGNGYKFYRHTILEYNKELDKAFMTTYSVDLREVALNEDVDEIEKADEDKPEALDLDAI